MKSSNCMSSVLIFLLCWFGITHVLYGQNRELTSEITGHRYVFYQPGSAQAVSARDSSTLRFNTSPAVDRISVMNYTLEANIHTESDLRKTVHGGTHWSGQAERGVIIYIPRITLTARNKPVEIGTTMVIEYFSHDVNDKNDINLEGVEHIPLVRTEQGRSIVFDGVGIPLFKAEHQASNLAGRRINNQYGREFSGIIVSLYHEGKLLFQQYAPHTLAKFCTANMPAPKAPNRRQQSGDKPPPRKWR